MMSITHADIQDFSRFASEQIANGETDLSMADLVARWAAAREREEVNTAIQEGLKAIEEGRTRPMGEFMAEFRQRHNLPSDV